MKNKEYMSLRKMIEYIEKTLRYTIFKMILFN